MKSLFLFIFSCLTLQTCSSQLSSPIKEAYTQSWTGGVRGGGSGTGFYITFQKALPEIVVVEQLYYRNQVAKVHTISETEFLFSFVGASNWNRGGDEPTSDAPHIKSVKAPVTITDKEALLQYTYKGKKRYYKITNIKVKEMLAYPSARPDGNEKN